MQIGKFKTFIDYFSDDYLVDTDFFCCSNINLFLFTELLFFPLFPNLKYKFLFYVTMKVIYKRTFFYKRQMLKIKLLLVMC